MILKFVPVSSFELAAASFLCNVSKFWQPVMNAFLVMPPFVKM
jgi:hypothetical protein